MYRRLYAVTVSFTAGHTKAATLAVVATHHEAEERIHQEMNECLVALEEDFAGIIDRENYILHTDKYTLRWEINEIVLDLERLAKEAEL